MSRAFWKEPVYLCLGSSEIIMWGSGQISSSSGRRELGPGRVGAGEAGLATTSGSRKGSWDVQVEGLRGVICLRPNFVSGPC